MNKPLLVGVTGGIGAGKSVVCKIFSSLGIPVYDADSRAKVLMTEDPELVDEIKILFGEQSYVNGQLNRPFLAAQVFPNEENLKKLNGLVHPAVARDTRRWIQEHHEQPYLIKEAALMIESGSYQSLDLLIVVTAPEELRIQRVLQRDAHRSREQVLDILGNQLSEEDRLEKANEVIQNDEETMVLPQVLELDRKFRTQIANRI